MAMTTNEHDTNDCRDPLGRGQCLCPGRSWRCGHFGATLERVLQGAIDSGHAAEGKATEAIAGGGNLTDVVTALARAELTLQSATAIRDRVVQAYQDIMKMPI